MASNVSFDDKNVKYLQEYLKDRGVVTTNKRKSELIDMCRDAKRVDLQFDPDGIQDNRQEALSKKKYKQMME